MQTKLLTALIIDQDTESAQKLSVSVRNSFNRLFVESDLNLGPIEYDRILPDILFINLSIAHRAASFEMLEKISFNLIKETIIFGVNDHPEKELLAHAIECGVHDILIRPLTDDQLSTRINRHLISERSTGKKHKLESLKQPLKAKVNLKFKLMSVDENGLTFKSDHFISKGIELSITDKLITEIFQLEAVPFLVTKTWMSENSKEHYFFVEPLNSNEQMNASLRKFILRKV